MIEKCLLTFGVVHNKRSKRELACKCLPFCSDAGKAFGEIALMNEDSVRTASIISDEDCDLMVINRTVYNATLKVSDNFTILNVSNGTFISHRFRGD